MANNVAIKDFTLGTAKDMKATDNASVWTPHHNVEFADTAASVNNGAADAGTLRVTVASDTTGVLSVDDNGSSLTVDGTVTANLSATDNAVLDQIEVNTSYGDQTGGGLEVSALRVTIASDSTGVLSVDDGGGALTVDGTVTANLSATDNAVLDSIATNTTGLNNAVSGSELQVDVVAPLPAGTNAIGKLAANSGVDIGDVDVLTLPGVAGDVAHDTADTGNPVKVGGVAYNTDGTAPGTAVVEGDRAEFATDVYGVQLANITHPNLWQADDNQSTAQTDTSIVAAPGVGLSLYITDVMVSAEGACNIFFEEGVTTLIPPIYCAATGGAVLNFRTPIRVTANTALTYTSSAAVNHSVLVLGYTAP